MTHSVIVVLAVFGVAGQVLVAAGLVVAGLALAGIRAPLEVVRAGLWGYEMWGVFLVTAIATGGSLFLSEVAGFIPCELCWYQRMCMYPLPVVALLGALTLDYGSAPYLLPLAVIGAGVGSYHLLVENKVVGQAKACLVSSPGGCATKWINEFGYITIPTLALTSFVLVLGLLGLALTGNESGPLAEAVRG